MIYLQTEVILHCTVGTFLFGMHVCMLWKDSFELAGPFLTVATVKESRSSKSKKSSALPVPKRITEGNAQLLAAEQI